MVPAEQEVSENQPVLHQLKAERLDRPYAFERGFRIGPGAALAQHGDRVHNHQHDQQRQNGAKAVVELFTDGHGCFPPHRGSGAG